MRGADYPYVLFAFSRHLRNFGYRSLCEDGLLAAHSLRGEFTLCSGEALHLEVLPPNRVVLDTKTR